MLPKKKPSLSVIIGMAGKPKGKPAEEPEMDEKDEGDDGSEAAHEDAMSEMGEALQKGDMSRAVEAFRTLYDLCAADHEGEKLGADEEEG